MGDPLISPVHPFPAALSNKNIVTERNRFVKPGKIRLQVVGIAVVVTALVAVTEFFAVELEPQPVYRADQGNAGHPLPDGFVPHAIELPRHGGHGAFGELQQAGIGSLPIEVTDDTTPPVIGVNHRVGGVFGTLALAMEKKHGRHAHRHPHQPLIDFGEVDVDFLPLRMVQEFPLPASSNMFIIPINRPEQPPDSVR